MFSIDSTKTIHITRGDIGIIEVDVKKSETERYIFQPGDLVRLKVFGKKQHENVVLSKDVLVEKEAMLVDIVLESDDTKIGDIINSPADYWYEIELNPDTAPQTIIGYDEAGPKVLRLYPEGGDSV